MKKKMYLLYFSFFHQPNENVIFMNILSIFFSPIYFCEIAVLLCSSKGWIKAMERYRYLLGMMGGWNEIIKLLFNIAFRLYT